MGITQVHSTNVVRYRNDILIDIYRYRNIAGIGFCRDDSRKLSRSSFFFFFAKFNHAIMQIKTTNRKGNIMTDYLYLNVNFLYEKKETAVEEEPDIRELFSRYGFTVTKTRKVQMNNVYRITADIRYDELLKKLYNIDQNDEEAVKRYLTNFQEIVDSMVDELPVLWYQMKVNMSWVINDTDLVC